MSEHKGFLYRALDVIWQKQPLSGEGAKLYGGRFNPVGMTALYTAMDPGTVVKEVMQGVGQLEPTTLVTYHADFDNLLDISTPNLARAHGISWDTMRGSNWRLNAKSFGTAPSQQIAIDAMNKGYDGLIVRSFAPRATAAEKNVVLYSWGDNPPCMLSLVDTKNQLNLTP